MLKEIILLIIIYFISMFYNYYINPFILSFISIYIYNNIIISLLILIQIDNFTLYRECEDAKLLKNIFLSRLNILLQKQKLSRSFNDNLNNLILNS